MELVGRRIVVTGVTGQVARPIAERLATDNEVIGLARFSDVEAAAELEAIGVRCCPVDLTNPDLSDVPDEVDVVVNFAVLKSGRWRKDLAGNAEAVGRLMSHFRSASAFLHCSSTAVLQPQGSTPLSEDSPHGDHHAQVMPTYSISKIAGESVARFAAREFELPTVIARMNVPYGDGGGWPLFHLEMMLADQPIEVHPDGSRYNPIHDDDILADLASLLDLASVPAAVINWSGADTVSVEEWCRHMGSLIGREPTFVTSDAAIPSAVIDPAAQAESLPTRLIDWRSGLTRLVTAAHPELLA